MKVRYREVALADLEGFFQFLNDRSPTGAYNLLRAIHEAVSVYPHEQKRHAG